MLDALRAARVISQVAVLWRFGFMGNHRDCPPPDSAARPLGARGQDLIGVCHLIHRGQSDFAPPVGDAKEPRRIIFEDELLSQHQIEQWHVTLRDRAIAVSGLHVQDVKHPAWENAESSMPRYIHDEVTAPLKLVTLPGVQYLKKQFPGARLGCVARFEQLERHVSRTIEAMPTKSRQAATNPRHLESQIHSLVSAVDWQRQEPNVVSQAKDRAMPTQRGVKGRACARYEKPS